MKPILIASAILALGSAVNVHARNVDNQGYNISPTGLRPVYPADQACPLLTSLYASWTDVDGTRRREPHSGVDGGQIGDFILAPADGVVRASWRADWGWGKEGALLILHRPRDLNMPDGSAYYSEFDHLTISDVQRFREGQVIRRGQRLARVNRPGGKRRYLPEVHWEVWEVGNDAKLRWRKNRFGRPAWVNPSARLVDPLYMLSVEPGTRKGSLVQITPFDGKRDFANYQGFTYPLACSSN